MVGARPDRRSFLTGLAALPVMAGWPAAARSDEFIDLDWEDLLPEGETTVPYALRSLLPHDESRPMSSAQPASSGVRSDWNGQIVRLPGFIVPIETSGSGVTAFILVPFVGACVHVPPPPANQLVFVTTPTPYETEGLFEPVNVIGMFGVSSLSTHIADIGYALSAEKIEPFQL